MCRYEQLTVRASDMREQLHTQVEHMLDFIIKFKVNIQKKLADQEDFITEETEAEMEHVDKFDKVDDEMEGVEET